MKSWNIRPVCAGLRCGYRGYRGLSALVRPGLVLVLVLVLVPAQAGATGFEAQVSADRHLDPAPLSALGADDLWRRLQPQSGDNLAYLADEARLGVRQRGWRWSLLARQRATVVASEAALRLGRVVEVTGRPTADQQWPVAVRALGFAGAGAEVAREWMPAPGWHAQLGVQLLRLTRLVERSAGGTAGYAADSGSYRFDLQSQQADDRLSFPFQQPAARTGLGLLTQGELGWRQGRLALTGRWRDAGRLRWRGLPQQALAARSDTQAVDADGYVVYAPLLVGQNRQPVYHRWLTPWLEAGAAWQLQGGVAAELAARRLPGWGWLPRIGVDLPVQGARVAAAWHWHERRAELRWRGGGWRLGLGVDRRHAAHSLSWQLGWEGTWNY